MKSYAKLAFSVLFTLTKAREIKYRDYKKGDKIDVPDFIFDQCEFKESVPCYVAVDTDRGNNVVVGYISIKIPDDLDPQEREAVKKKMPNPTKKGIFGYIEDVGWVLSMTPLKFNHNLSTVEASTGEAHKVLAMTLHVKEENVRAIKLYEMLGFIKIMSKEEEKAEAAAHPRSLAGSCCFP
ncbi:hypothetical protein FOL47_009759 [Perkinsus chesapeaki]|uniref:Uncharacterized protein n=1 Tax=Perkinsus chesapeaki TaxID=330153 RepID=A0A7J6MS88_PERCH|nr:hypothetical protein FOL47_009759 [Perkinsus chesapeaki]